MNRLPETLCNLACRLLPEARRPWADAMRAELGAAAADGVALGFAGGCLWAALRERIGDTETRFGAGLWAVAIATAFLAVVQMACAARGVAVLMGAPDGMRAVLVAAGAVPDVVMRYEAARPLVIGCFLALGGVQLVSAWLLSRGQLRAFGLAWAAVLLIAGIAVAIQLSIFWRVDGLPSEFHAVLLQAITVPGLIAWYQHRQRVFERERS